MAFNPSMLKEHGTFGYKQLSNAWPQRKRAVTVRARTYIYIYTYLGLRKPAFLLLFPEFPLILPSSDNYRFRAIFGFSPFCPIYPILSHFTHPLAILAH